VALLAEGEGVTNRTWEEKKIAREVNKRQKQHW